MSQSIFINNEVLGLEKDEGCSYIIVDNIENADIITKYIKDNNISVRRGDIIDTIDENNRYRNDGKFVWDGEKVLSLEYDVDDYGAIPKTFIVSSQEFAPNYWENTIDHNNYYWPSIEYREQVRNSLVFDDEFTNQKEWHGCFTHDDRLVHVIIDDNYSSEIDSIYNPDLNVGVFMSRGGKYYSGTPARERNPKEFFMNAIMDANHPFDHLAENSIEIKDENSDVSYLQIS